MPSPMRNNRQLRRLGAALLALVVLFATMAVTARGRTQVTAVEKGIATVLYPFQVATNWVADRFRVGVETVRGWTRLHEENQALKAELQESAQAKDRAAMLEAENDRLRMEIQAKERAKYPLLSAQVIGRSSENWYRTVTINRGSADGVAQSMPVVNWQGLVGKVLHITPHTATVQLLTDSGFGQQGFGAGVKLPTGELGVVETVEGGHVRMKFFSTSPAVQAGQQVFTSGQGVMPPDLLVGWVEAVPDAASVFEKSVNVRPAVDFNKLDMVQVVLALADQEKGASAP